MFSRHSDPELRHFRVTKKGKHFRVTGWGTPQGDKKGIHFRVIKKGGTPQGDNYAGYSALFFSKSLAPRFIPKILLFLDLICGIRAPVKSEESLFSNYLFNTFFTSCSISLLTFSLPRFNK